MLSVQLNAENSIMKTKKKFALMSYATHQEL